MTVPRAHSAVSTAPCSTYTPGKFMSNTSRYGTAPPAMRQAM